MEKQNKQNVDAKAAELREKLEDESLDNCKVEGGGAGAMDTDGPPPRDK